MPLQYYLPGPVFATYLELRVSPKISTAIITRSVLVHLPMELIVADADSIPGLSVLNSRGTELLA